MPNPVFPAIGSTSWYPWAQSIHDALIAVRQRPPVVGVPFYARGTSYTGGAGVAATPNDFVEVTAAALGSTVTYNTGTGGSTTPSLVNQYADNATGKWIPGTSTGLVSLEVGIGEALQEDDATWAGHRAVFENQVLTALRWHRASSLRKPGSSSTITTDATGTSTESLPDVGAVLVSPGIKLINNGAGFTITLNEARDDIDIVLLSIPWKNSSDTTNNGDYRIQVGSGAWRSATTKGRGDPRPDGSNVTLTLASERITGLARNAVIRVEKVSGSEVWFYGYLLMGNQNPPPIVLLQNTPLVESAGQWVIPAGNGFTAGARRNTATLNVYRNIVNNIVTYPEFRDGSVTTADPFPRWDPSIHLAADGVHPNDAGHAIYAAALQSAALRVGSS